MAEIKSDKRRLLTRLAAELAVIVVGVLIALWADSQVAERADRRIEANRVAALRENVEATRERLDQELEQTESARAALTEIARADDARAIARRSDLVLSGLLYGPMFTPEMNVYLDLKSSGDLALLRSADLRQSLARMDATFEQLSTLQSDLMLVQQLNIDPFVIRELDLGTTFGPYLGLEDLPAAPGEPNFDLRTMRNLALFKLDFVEQLTALYRESLEVLDEVEEAM